MIFFNIIKILTKEYNRLNVRVGINIALKIVNYSGKTKGFRSIKVYIKVIKRIKIN